MPRESTLDWVGRLAERERPGTVVLINAEPGRSRRAALTHPRQGRHRPRSWLAEPWVWMALCLPHCRGKRTEGSIEKGGKGVDF